ncbi:FxSxx-COOH system tetratricopeptide repeat protein [Streptomyces sp. NPDC002676]
MDERPDNSDAVEACDADRSGAADEPLSGELLPLGDAAGAAGVHRGLKPIADDVGPERHELAVALRRLFLVLDISVRGYAVTRDYSASSVSRYLSGETVAPRYFLARLMDDVGRKLGRPLAREAQTGLTRMQSVALKATSSRAWKVQDLEDQLVVALREKEVARTQADVVATALHESRARVADLEAERQALVQQVSASQVTAVELDLLREEQQRVRSERDALRQRVSELERALEGAEQRVALAEQRVDDLEHQLQAADAAMAAEEQREGQRAEAEGNGKQAGPEGGRQWPVVSPGQTSVVSGLAIVFPGYHRSWAVWIAQVLQRHGHQVTLRLWDPPRETPLEDSLGNLLLDSLRVLLVLNDWFFELGPRPAGEWNDVLRGFVAANVDRFAAVNLTNRPLLPAASVLQPASLWALSEEAAEERLLGRLGLGQRDATRALVRYPELRCEIWGEVPRRNPRFTGRDDVLGVIHERLSGAERGAAACTLLGMSGIGKTQLAAEYAHRFSTDYDLVWWVNSDDHEVRRDRFGELAAELGLPIDGEPGERIRAVRDALRRGEPYANWLVVFDGWDDSEGINALLPEGSGHVLITSRNRAWTEYTDVLEVPGFLRAESTAYLMRRAPHITAAEADEVAAEFGDVPLPLVQAASWLGESRMEVPEYLRMIRERKFSTVDEPATGEGFPQSSMTSWSILLNRLRRSQPQAMDVLKLCTAFAPGRIPLGLVHTCPQAELPEELRWMATDQPAWSRALDTLVNYSVLARDTGAPAEAGPFPESVHMHRLVQDIVFKLASDDSREQHRRAARALLTAADPGHPEDSRHWPRYAELLPHLEPSGALESTRPQVREAILNSLRYCHHSGEIRAGLDLARRVRDAWSANTGPVASPMLDLAAQESALLMANGRFRDAYEQDRGLLERLEKRKKWEARPPSRFLDEYAAKSAVARGLRHLGRYQEAYELHWEVLGGRTELLGPDEPTTLDARHELGVCLRLLGKYEEAYDRDMTTLSLRERLLGQRHISTLDSGTAVNQSLRLLGSYRAAAGRQEKLVRRHEKEFGARHPQTLDARLQLALCRRGDAPTQDVEDELADLLAQLEQVHGRAHHRTLACVTAYADFLREHGEPSRARELIVEAESGYRALLGSAHPVVVGMLSSSGLVMQAMGEHGEAMALLEAALAGLTTTLGADHPWALGCALNTACARSRTGRDEEALELSRVTYPKAARSLGDQHPLTLSCQVALVADLVAAGQDNEAEKLEREALLSLSRTLTDDHVLTTWARTRTRPHWDFEPYVG